MFANHQNIWQAHYDPLLENFLVEVLNVSDQDGQVLDAEVHIVVHVLMEALIRPGVSRGRNTRLETASPGICHTSLPSLGSPHHAYVSVRLTPMWLQSNPNPAPAEPWTLDNTHPSQPHDKPSSGP